MEGDVQAADESKEGNTQLVELRRQAFEMSGTSDLDLTLTQNGDIKNNISNVSKIIHGDKYFDGKFALNALDEQIYVAGFFWMRTPAPHPLEDNDLYNIERYVCDMYQIGNEKSIKKAVSMEANDHWFHPVQDKLNNLKWDGVPRIGELLPKYLGAERSEYTTAVTLLLLHGAIQRVFHPGCKFDHCIVLADTKQGTGKSTLCRYLALNDDWFTDKLEDMNDTKKAYESIRGFWVVELGEMIATRNAKDVEHIKAFISRMSDVYRDPFGIFAKQRKRQCVFIGTTNKPHFLPDDKSGNRRFLPVFCDGDRAEVHPMADEEGARAFVEQCYAEAMEIGKRDGWTLTLDEKFDALVAELQEEAAPEDTRVGMIQAYLNNVISSKEQKAVLVCSRMIYREVFDIEGRNEPKKFELEDITEIMKLKIKGWEPYHGRNGKAKSSSYRFKNYGTQRAWQPVNWNAEQLEESAWQNARVGIYATDYGAQQEQKERQRVNSPVNSDGFTPVKPWEEPFENGENVNS